MAPRYAPSLRSRLAPVLLFLQTGFIVIYVFYTEIHNKREARGKTFSSIYSDFQDVNVMVILGFGFLGTFLVRYGFSATAFNLLVAAMATQWAIVLNGFQFHMGKVMVDLKSLVEAEMCAASALISIGALLGKTNPVQLVLIALLEVSGFILNKWFLQSILKVLPQNSIMMLFVFGSFFGLMLTWCLYRKTSEQGFEKEKLDRKTGLFSMLGSLFLWMFWPSFNSVLVDDTWPVRGRRLMVVYSTYLALAVSAVTAAAVSVLCSHKGKLNLIHLQSCILAGGVAVGVSMPAVHQPWEAMVIGFTAAIVASIGHRYLKEHMLVAFQCHDTGGVLSTYGLPGLLGWLAHFILQLTACEDHTVAIRFAVFHICSLLATIATSLSLGIFTGLLLKWNFWRSPQDKKCFDDQAFWEFPNLMVRK